MSPKKQRCEPKSRKNLKQLMVKCQSLISGTKCTIVGTILLWIQLCPLSKNMCWHSNSQYLRMCLYLDIGSLQSNQFKTRLLVWALIPYDLHPYKKGKYGHWFDWDGHREDHLKTPGECHLQAKGCLRPPETGGEAWSRFSPTALTRNQFCWHLDFSLLASFQDCKTIHFCCFSYPICGTFLQRLY